MGPSQEKVLAEVKARIVPTPGERRLIARLSDELKGELEAILSKKSLEAEVSLQGSVAHDTWLRGEHDLDIFARFPEKVERREWTEEFLPAVRSGFRGYRKVERYAEHPYLELLADHNVRVNIVPCYAVERGEWKSATDRSPFHTEYMASRLTPELRDEARLLKKFMKGINVYGAEIRVGGFSGMLVETLTLQFRAFVETLERASDWKSSVFINVEKGSSRRKFESDFVVVDPVDPERNLAAAVRQDVLWSFVAAARQFLEKPRISFFYPPKAKQIGRSRLSKWMRGPRHDIVGVCFGHPRLVLDVLWGQLFSLERALVSLAGRYDFQVIRSQAWSNEKRLSAILLEVDRFVLPQVQIHRGPPVSRREESGAFLTRHLGNKMTVGGPWLSQGRWVVERRREVSAIKDLIGRAINDERFGFAPPKQLGKSFRKSRVLVNEDLLSLLDQQGFEEALYTFLDGTPTWLRQARS